MKYDAIKKYLEYYLSKNPPNTLKTDLGVQINDLRGYIKHQMYLVEKVEPKLRVDNTICRASKSNLKLIVDYLESL